MKTNSCLELPKHFSRREFMHVGLVGGLGLTLADFMRIKAHGAQKYYETVEGPAKSVIHIYLPGGMAHQESFDPKPYAPLEYRVLLKALKLKYPEFTSARTSRKLQKLRTKLPFVVP